MKRPVEKAVLSLLVCGLVAGGTNVAIYANKVQNANYDKYLQTITRADRETAKIQEDGNIITYDGAGQLTVVDPEEDSTESVAAYVDALTFGDKEAVARYMEENY